MTTQEQIAFLKNRSESDSELWPGHMAECADTLSSLSKQLEQAREALEGILDDAACGYDGSTDAASRFAGIVETARTYLAK